MAANNSNQPNLNVGLNLNGNAIGTVQQLTDRMIALKQVALDVGSALKQIDVEMKQQGAGRRPTLQSLKSMQQNVNMLGTTPDTILAQFYRNQNKAVQSQNLNNLVNTRRQLTNTNTLNSLFDQYGTKTVGEAIQIRLSAAQLKNDTKAIQRAQLEMQTFKAEMEKYNTSLKGLQQLKITQDHLVSQMLKTPVGSVALTNNMQGKLERQYYTGAQEKAVRNYMADPSKLTTRDNDFSKSTAAQLKNYTLENGSKIEATKRIMGQLYLDGSTQSKIQLENYNKILAALEQEKVKLQAIASIRRTSLKQQDEQIQKLRAEQNTTKATEQINKLLNGTLNTKTLSADRIAQLNGDDLIARQVTMTKRLAQAKQVMFKAEEIGNKKARKDAESLVVAYQKELDMIKRRNAELNQAGKGNGLVNRFNDMNTGESSGALLGIQGLLMRNYMLWGAFVGSISGSYAFLRDFEMSLKQTQAISQATDTQMQDLKESILEVAENSRFSAIEITDAATALAQAGFSMSEIQKTLESVTLLATATGSTLKETVDIATASLGAFQLSAENMPSIVNKITQAMNLSKLDIQKFQLAVQYAGNAASDAGLSFDELLASVSTVANAGVRSGSTLGTGFRQLLSDLIAPSSKFESILTRLGLTTADVDVRTNGLVGALKRLKEAGFTTADAYESFEVRSVAFYTALSNNLETYDDLTANLNNNTAAAEANEIQMNSLGAQTDRMFNQFKALAEVTGSGVRDSLTDLFHVIGDVLTVMKDLTNNGVVNTIVKATAMTAALTGAIVVIKGMASAVAGLYTALTAGGAALSATVPIIAAISAGVSLAILAFKAFKNSNDELKIAVEASKTAVNKLSDSISNLQTEVIEIDKKITSLESRFESLQEDPAAVAVEFANLQNKAAELGVSLGDDLVSSIESVRKGWEMLRNELSKSLVVDLSQQIEEIDILAQKMLSLKVAEAANKADMFSEKGAKDGGYGKVVDFNSLEYFSNSPLAVATDKNAAVRRNAQFTSGSTYNTNLFKAISDANKAAGGSGGMGAIEKLLKSVADDPRQLSMMTPEEQEKAIPAMRKQYLEAQAIINNARKQYIYAGRKAQTKEQKDAAEEMVKTLDNFKFQLADRAGTVNSLYSNFSQRDSLTRQRDVEQEVVNLRSKLISGDVSDLTVRSDFGNALSLGKQGTAKRKYNSRELAELMPTIKKLSKQYGVPEDLIVGHMITESGVNQGVTSSAGAVGLMQVMPAATKDIGMDFGRAKSDKLYNLEAGVKYLAKMKKDTGGTWEDASRGYFMGAGGLKEYKSTNGRSYAKGFNQSTDYVKSVYANVLDYQKTRGGRYSILDSLDIPENTVATLSEIDTLNAIVEGAKSQVAAKGAYNQLSEADKKLVDKWTAQIQAAEKIISEKSANTNNVIRAAQARDKAERDREKGFQQISLQKVTDTVQMLELQIAEAEHKLEKGDFTKEGIDKLNKLYADLREASQKQETLQAHIKVLDSATYDGTNLIVDQTFQQLADMQLEAAIKKSDTSVAKKRRESLDKASKAFIERLKEQNQKFLTDFKNEMTSVKEEFDLAMEILDFQSKVFDRQLNETTGLTKLRRERSLMDDPLYRDQYSDVQRSDMDHQIEKMASTNSRDSTIFTESRIAANEEYLAKINELISEFEIKQRESQIDLDLKLGRSGLTDSEKEALHIETKKKLVEFEKEINKYKEQAMNVEDQIALLKDELKNIDPTNRPNGYSIGQMFKSKIDASYREMSTAAYAEGNVTKVIDSITGSFDTLINTALEASDNVDDFFKIITGGSSKSRDAFKAFGYSIVQTMAKIVQDAMVRKFLSMMANFVFGNSGGEAGGGSGVAGWIGTVVGAIANSFGQGVISGGPKTGSAGSVVVDGQVMPLTYASQGGLVKGTAKNVDSEPYMLAHEEYILPSNVTDTVGQGFLDRLRKDPAGVMNEKIQVNVGGNAKATPPSFTNVYVVSPDQVPSSTSKNDIIVVIEDNVARNGRLKQLIKTVANT